MGCGSDLITYMYYPNSKPWANPSSRPPGRRRIPSKNCLSICVQQYLVRKPCYSIRWGHSCYRDWPTCKTFDPTQETPEKQVVATFTNVLGLTGITESAHNVFYITGANNTSATICDPLKNATQVWRVDYSGNTTEPVITHIASPTYPTIIDFNGLAAYNESIILASASHDNAIAAVDVETGRT
ncbi:hypothetical protein BTUL_0069g00410 [Botrytis tulipae]|uniref:Uncharacterized protein n=1 Tax=Botrytis tulipae TaxID=87230 RepID=A0A4Z1EM51_9HELO|nr:hypothetical protein BTUL_0069g00410 [Botrytis tulipae]